MKNLPPIDNDDLIDWHEKPKRSAMPAIVSALISWAVVAALFWAMLQ